MPVVSSMTVVPAGENSSDLALMALGLEGAVFVPSGGGLRHRKLKTYDMAGVATSSKHTPVLKQEIALCTYWNSSRRCRFLQCHDSNSKNDRHAFAATVTSFVGETRKQLSLKVGCYTRRSYMI